MAAIARDSAETGRHVHIHLLETRRQRDWADAAYPGGLLVFLDSIGLLGPRLTIAHAVWLRADERALLAARGVTVSVNASSNLRLRSGHAPMAAMRAAGLGCGIGMDGMSLDDDEDMLRELRLCWHMNAADDGPAPGLGAVDILDAGLRAGRLGITGEDGGGRLAIGAPADMMTLDFGEIARDCVHRDPDPVPLLVGRATRRHVRQVVVDGRTIVADGRCTGIDLAALEEGLTMAARAAMHAAPPDQTRIERMQRAVAHYYDRDCHQAAPGKPLP
jgi:cytosine/adenosine deaminase-related metal-dependent hydrolase